MGRSPRMPAISFLSSSFFSSNNYASLICLSLLLINVCYVNAYALATNSRAYFYTFVCKFSDQVIHALPSFCSLGLKASCPIVLDMPYLSNFSIASRVARCRSSIAPVEMSYSKIRYATRPPINTHNWENKNSSVWGYMASSCTCCVYPPALPRGMMEILMTSFCSGWSHAMIQCPHSWYAVRRSDLSLIRWRCFLPINTSSMLFWIISNDTTYSPTVAAFNAASLTMVATCAGLTPGVRSAST